MSLFKRNPEAEWWSFRFMRNGKVYQGTCAGCETFQEALDFESRYRALVVKGSQSETLAKLYRHFEDDLIQSNPVPLKKAFDMAMAKPRRRTPGEHRESFLRQYWNDFLYFMARMHPDVTVLQRVTKDQAEQYIATIRKFGNFADYFNRKTRGGLSNFTLNEMHNICIRVFDLLQSKTQMPENPFKGIEKLPSDSDSHEPYTMDELQRIFDKADDRLYPIFFVGLFSGLRLGDICTMRKTEISWDRHVIFRRQNKTGGDATIPMHPCLEKYLRELCDKAPDSRFVLPALEEQYTKNASTISNWVRAFLEKDLGIVSMKEVEGRKQAVNVKGIHSLRHTFCTIAGVAGIPETVVRSIMGHMTPKMTRLYTQHVDDADKLRCIQLFGKHLGDVGDLPIDISTVDPKAIEIQQKEEAEHREKLAAVIACGKERDRLINLARRIPIDVVRELIVELQDKYPEPHPTTANGWID